MSNPWGVNRLVFNYEKFLLDEAGRLLCMGSWRRYGTNGTTFLLFLQGGETLGCPSFDIEVVGERSVVCFVVH